jgi:NADPH:quinone reductase-like Zn-dependent oxidoreductase
VALGIAGLAAWLPLTRRAQLQRGESVLVLGASGIVGQVAVQAARLLGAGRVVAAARRRPTLEKLLEHGADEIVVLEDDVAAALKSTAGNGGFDVVLDPLYVPSLEAALRATSQFARMVTVGAGAGQTATIPVNELFVGRLSGHGNRFAPVEHRREACEGMAAHALAGEIVVEVKKLPLSDIRTAWALQARGPDHKLTIIP